MKTTQPILLDPELGVPWETFAEAWADDPECRAAGEIALPETNTKSGAFENLDPATAMAIGALISTGAALAKDLILILVKRALARADERLDRQREDEVEVKWVDDPETGVPVIQVREP